MHAEQVVALLLGLTALGLSVFWLVSLWRVFEKAGQPGWATLVPIYNGYVLLKLVGRPGWWLILLFVPCVGVVFHVLVMMDLARSFGRREGFGVGLLLLPVVFVPLLAWSESAYLGPSAAPRNALPD